MEVINEGNNMVLCTRNDDCDGKVNGTIWSVQTIRNEKEAVVVYNYEEALDIGGTGWYHYGLLFTTSVSIIAMGIDMFGFSVIVTGCACDFQLTPAQKSILLSMPFLGPIFMSYIWGYVSDTRGRKKSLLYALWGSFILAILGAFSPNWIILAVLKFVSTSLCSCAQSSTFALLGESCPKRIRGAYILIMTSIFNLDFAGYMIPAYFILNLEVMSYDLQWITFNQWRLLALVLAFPLGLSAICLHFFHESPKFLVNDGQETLALEYLKNIWRTNGGRGAYPVKCIVLNEEGNVQRKKEPLLKSLWSQTIPLFKPPLLVRSLQLYYITAVIYSVSNSFLIWFPDLAQSFVRDLNDEGVGNQTYGICNLIMSSSSTNKTANYSVCKTGMDLTLIYTSLIQSFVFFSFDFALFNFSSYKKTFMIIILSASCVTSACAVIVTSNLVAFILFFGLLLSSLCMGFVFSYFVDLYPTSHRGMAACLGVMVARASALAGVNLVGTFVISHCTVTFYSCAFYVFSGVIVSCFLPPDNSKKLS